MTSHLLSCSVTRLALPRYENLSHELPILLIRCDPGLYPTTEQYTLNDDLEIAGKLKEGDIRYKDVSRLILAF